MAAGAGSVWRGDVVAIGAAEAGPRAREGAGRGLRMIAVDGGSSRAGDQPPAGSDTIHGIGGDPARSLGRAKLQVGKRRTANPEDQDQDPECGDSPRDEQ